MRLPRYLLFSGSSYYAAGGWNDYKGAFLKLETALAAGAEIVRRYKADRDGKDVWWHVVDFLSESVIGGGDSFDPSVGPPWGGGGAT